MRLSGHEINSQLRQKLAMPTGRHLYVVLGTYERIERYERVAFREARSPDDKPLGPALNINLSLLQRFGDEELKWLVRNEAGMQETVKKQLADELNALVADKLMETSFLAIKSGSSVFKCKTSRIGPSGPWPSGGCARSSSRSLATPDSSPGSIGPTDSSLTSVHRYAW